MIAVPQSNAGYFAEGGAAHFVHLAHGEHCGDVAREIATAGREFCKESVARNFYKIACKDPAGATTN